MFAGTGAELTSYFFNALIQIYSMFSSYYFFITILPTILRFRLVYDYRIAHEVAKHKDGAEQHTFFHGFFVVCSQSFFSTILISVLVCEPAPTFVHSTPLFITWCVFTLLWYCPIKMILFLSRYLRWVSSLAGIIHECNFVIISIERGITACYQFRTGIMNSLYYDTLTSEPGLIAGITTISVPMSLLCGFLAVHGNSMVSEFLNLNGDFRLKTPAQLKNPFFEVGKIGVWLVILYVLFVVTFVPAEMFSKGYIKHRALLLPTITMENVAATTTIPTTAMLESENSDVKLCIKQQQRNKQFCGHDLLLSWCYHPQTKSIASQTLTFSLMEEVYNEMMCNLALTAIHITGTKPCMSEDGLQPITLQLQDDHEKHERISKRVLSLFHKRTTKYTASEIFPLSPVPSSTSSHITTAWVAPTHAYATTPIEQVGQPVLARMIRHTWSVIITQPLQYIVSISTQSMGNFLFYITSFVLDIAPHDLTQHLQTQNHHEECMYTHELSLSPHQPQQPQQPPQDENTTHVLLPSEQYKTLARSTIPSDTLFFIHIPVSPTVTTIIPLTFSLFKSIFLAIWSMLYFWYFFQTRFQSPAAASLLEIHRLQAIQSSVNEILPAISTITKEDPSQPPQLPSSILSLSKSTSTSCQNMPSVSLPSSPQGTLKKTNSKGSKSNTKFAIVNHH